MSTIGYHARSAEVAWPHDPVMPFQMRYVAKIIRDETRLEAERRQCPVAADDPIVQSRVCEIILQLGTEIRAWASADLVELRERCSTLG